MRRRPSRWSGSKLESLATFERLAADDPSLKVRQAAIEARRAVSGGG